MPLNARRGMAGQPSTNTLTRWLASRATKRTIVRPSAFFFQAEDGIRDADVTGVQTCALPISEESLAERPMTLKAGLAWTGIGLVLLVISSRILVWGAVAIAQGFGVSDLIIGLTVVAVGTSLPELASSSSALRRRGHDLVLGNVVGSNLFNSLGVVGLAAVIHPIQVGAEVLLRDWSLMAAMTVLMAVFAVGWRGREGRINRLEGAVLLTMFLAYTAWLVRLVLSGAP